VIPVNIETITVAIATIQSVKEGLDRDLQSFPFLSLDFPVFFIGGFFFLIIWIGFLYEGKERYDLFSLLISRLTIFWGYLIRRLCSQREIPTEKFSNTNR